jgi:hypothetical protein
MPVKNLDAHTKTDRHRHIYTTTTLGDLMSYHLTLTAP